MVAHAISKITYSWVFQSLYSNILVAFETHLCILFTKLHGNYAITDSYCHRGNAQYALTLCSGYLITAIIIIIIIIIVIVTLFYRLFFYNHIAGFHLETWGNKRIIPLTFWC